MMVEDNNTTDAEDSGGSAPRGEPLAPPPAASMDQAKINVYLALVFCCVTASIVAYVSGRNREDNHMEDDFLNFAREIQRVTMAGIHSSLDVAESLAIEASSFAHDSNLSFPFVVLPNFELRTRQAREMTRAELVMLLPLLDKGHTPQHMEWENYVGDHAAEWIAEGHGYQEVNHHMVDAGPVPRQVQDLPSNLLQSGTHDQHHRFLPMVNSSAANMGHTMEGSNMTNTGHNNMEQGHNMEPTAAEHADMHHMDGYKIADQFMAPCWQTGPAPSNATIINSDFMGFELFADQASVVTEQRKGSLSIIDASQLLHQFLVWHFPSEGDNDPARINHNENHSNDHPFSLILEPIFDNLQHHQSNIVAFIAMLVQWDVFFHDILPEGVNGLEVVISDSCGSVFTYVLDGPRGLLLGVGDLHDTKHEERTGLVETAVIANVTTNKNFHAHDGAEETGDSHHQGDAAAQNQCQFVLNIYPTADFQSLYTSNQPIVSALLVAGIFVFSVLVFLIYDLSVQFSQYTIATTANKSLAIVSSFFPREFRDRMLAEEEAKRRAEEEAAIHPFNRARDQLSSFLSSGGSSAASSCSEDDDDDWEGAGFGNGDGERKSKPIADLFPEATVVFADIVGFTAWSSTREPPQVFQLLETIYHVFDKTANRRRVFKVETVGDCYVAVAGLPEPRKDHATTMVRFARDCLMQFNATVKSLVVELGPDTEDLQLRLGVHSGPVVAGVLRGERARFQLFGDTMNTTARLETTGLPGRIQVSQETANLLVAEGKASWVRAREEMVDAKGKGKLQTFWLESTSAVPLRGSYLGSNTDPALTESDLDGDTEHSTVGPLRPTEEPSPPQPSFSEKYRRLVAWNFDILSKFLSKLVEHRECRHVQPDPFIDICRLEKERSANRYILGECPEFVRSPSRKEHQMRTLHIHAATVAAATPSKRVLGQLQDYVQTLAAMYRDNPFHNFEHASHVTMSVVKLLARIAPDLPPTTSLHCHQDHTHGITSDPLLQFGLALSALIHDVDHMGVPNAQLVTENPTMAAVYKNQSIAEQNSFDLAWDLLMDDEYRDLRRAIYTTQADFLRFRQIAMTLVLATDLLDPELNARRQDRWTKAFPPEVTDLLLPTTTATDNDEDDAVDRKASIVAEIMMQASDVAHTMQHWQIYRKWNQRLFFECLEAYAAGRATNDPTADWYEAEVWFFNETVIPLAQRLQQCGVFGVAGDEYLQYALQNQKEWQRQGPGIVSEMLEAYQKRRRGGGMGAGGSGQSQSPSQRSVLQQYRELSNREMRNNQ